MFIVIFDLAACAYVIKKICKRIKKKEFHVLKKLWLSSLAVVLVTTVVETVYNELLGGSVGLFTMDIENAIFLIMIFVGLCLFALLSCPMFIIFVNKILDKKK